MLIGLICMLRDRSYLFGDIEVLDVKHNEVGLLLHVQIDGNLTWEGGKARKSDNRIILPMNALVGQRALSLKSLGPHLSRLRSSGWDEW